MNFLAGAEIAASLIGEEGPVQIATDGALLDKVYNAVQPEGGNFQIAALAKLPKDEMADALAALGRQCADLAKIVKTQEYGYTDVCEILTSV